MRKRRYNPLECDPSIVMADVLVREGKIKGFRRTGRREYPTSGMYFIAETGGTKGQATRSAGGVTNGSIREIVEPVFK